MFAKTIIDSDAFIDMPTTARLLYYDLSMRADDDGFINAPKKICRMTGASDDDLKILIMKRFIIPFESGVVVIKHWKIHNYIRQDRYKETEYREEKAQLRVKENKAYSLIDTNGIPMVDQRETQVRLGKDRIGEVRIEEEEKADKPPRAPRFTPPSIDEVRAYCEERGNNVDPQRFIDFYAAKGWMVGRNKMKDWKAAVRTWEQRGNDSPRPQQPQQQKSGGDRLLEMIRRGDFDDE
jgi:hypothetical protein